MHCPACQWNHYKADRASLRDEPFGKADLIEENETRLQTAGEDIDDAYFDFGGKREVHRDLGNAWFGNLDIGELFADLGGVQELRREDYWIT